MATDPAALSSLLNVDLALVGGCPRHHAARPERDIVRHADRIGVPNADAPGRRIDSIDGLPIDASGQHDSVRLHGQPVNAMERRGRDKFAHREARLILSRCGGAAAKSQRQKEESFICYVIAPRTRILTGLWHDGHSGRIVYTCVEIPALRVARPQLRGDKRVF